MRDHVYDQVPFRLSELEHKYGPNVHIVADPFMLTQLASLCAKETIQPEINRLVAALYADLMRLVVSHAFPRAEVSVPTRMVDHTPQGIFHGQLIARNTRAVVVNIARAGTLPSQVTSGKITRDTLVWKQGMANWVPAEQVSASGYWRRGITNLDHHAPLDPSDPD